jgi:2-oxoglutarate ferredoxin oxidoreductase subunit alpha
VPVILLMDETVGHLREGVELLDASEAAASDRLARDDVEQAEKPYAVLPGEYAPRLSPFGHGAPYNITGLIHDDRGFPTSSKEAADRLCRRSMKKIAMNAGEIERCESRHMEDAQVCVVSFGGTARAVQAAVDAARGDGIRVGLFRPITVWPFPEAALGRICGRVRDIVVAELNGGQMKMEAERVAAGRCRVHHLGRVNGAILTPGEILAAIREVAG